MESVDLLRVESPVVDVGAGLVVPARLGCRRNDADQVKVEIWCDLEIDEGRYLPTEVTVFGSDVTSNVLKAIPIAALVRGMASRAIYGQATGDGGFVVKNHYELLPDGQLPRGRGALDDKAYSKIGLVYLIRRLFSWRATTDVAEHFGVSRATSLNWIKEAERRGLLAPILDDARANEMFKYSVAPDGESITVLKGDSMPPKELSAELAYRQTRSAEELATLLTQDALFSTADVEAEVARRYPEGSE